MAFSLYSRRYAHRANRIELFCHHCRIVIETWDTPELKQVDREAALHERNYHLKYRRPTLGES